MPNTVRLWLTDGSPLPMMDLYQLETTHPTLMGAPGPYKGTVDPEVYVGEATITATLPDDALFPKAEWCVTFPEGIDAYLREPEQIRDSTPVAMQGLIEGKWLNRLLGRLDAWTPASLGNNLLADGPGVLTTLGALEAGVAGEMEVTYPLPMGGTRTQASALADLVGQNVPALVREVLRQCRQLGEAVAGIDVSAVGERAAVVNEPWRLQQAMAELAPAGPPTPGDLAGLGEQVLRGILGEGIGAPSGEPIRIEVRDGDGLTVGGGALTWHYDGGG